MKKLLFLSSLALVFAATHVTAQTTAGQQSYGATFTQAPSVITPARVQYIMQKKDQEEVQLGGFISEVCQKEGCWIRLRTDLNRADDILVKMKDHAFVLPKDLAGRKAVVNGTLVKKIQSVAEQKHYLEDAGASAEELAKITQPKETYVMQATGVIVYDK